MNATFFHKFESLRGIESHTSIGRLLNIAVVLFLLASPGVTSSIQLTVVEKPSGSSVPSAQVQVTASANHAVLQEMETNDNGSCRTLDVPAGEYTITVAADNCAKAHLDVPISASSPSLLTITVPLAKYGVIAGHVQDGNNGAITGATVFALEVHGNMLGNPYGGGREASVGPNGEYRLYGLAPGEYVIAATYGASTYNSGSSFATANATASGVLLYPSASQPQIFRISAGEEYDGVDIAAPVDNLSDVTGHVSMSTPIDGFWVALTRSDQPILATAISKVTADGTFAFHGIQPGGYELLAYGPAHGGGTRGKSLDAHPLFGRSHIDVNGTLTDVTVAPEKGRTASIKIFTARSECSEAAQIHLVPLEDFGADVERMIPIRVPEVAHVSDLIPGRYQLSFVSRAGACYSPSTVLDTTTSDASDTLSINQKGMLSGSVISSDGQRNLFTVRLVRDDGQSVDQEATEQVAYVSGNSQFTFPRVIPGQYRLIATSIAATPAAISPPVDSERTTSTQTVQVLAGKATTVNICPKACGDNRQ